MRNFLRFATLGMLALGFGGLLWTRNCIFSLIVALAVVALFVLVADEEIALDAEERRFRTGDFHEFDSRDTRRVVDSRVLDNHRNGTAAPYKLEPREPRREDRER